MRSQPRIITSALKHGVTADTIRHVWTAWVYKAELREEPLKIALLGLDPELRPIEVVYVIDDDGTPVIIHAMPATQALLNRARRERRRSR